MSENDDQPTKEEALDYLDDARGQSYVTSETAATVLQPFRGDVTDDFAERYDVSDFPDLALPRGLADEQILARDASGMVNAQPWRPIITLASVSELLVEALGGEPSSSSAIGSGFDADQRHSGNVSTLREMVDLDDE